MRLRHLVAAAILLAPIPFAGVSEPAHAAIRHQVDIAGWLSVEDIGAGKYEKRPIGFEFDLTHEATTESTKFEICTDKDTRAELFIQAKLVTSERVAIQSSLSLFEGDDCRNAPRTALSYGPNRIVYPFRKGVKVGLYAASTENLAPSFGYAQFTATHEDTEPPERPEIRFATYERPDPVKPIRRIAVVWKDRASDEIGYEILNATKNQTRTVPRNSARCEWAHLGPMTSECFKVRALGRPLPSPWSELVCTQ